VQGENSGFTIGSGPAGWHVAAGFAFCMDASLPREISSAELAALSARLGSAALARRLRMQHQLEVDPESDEAGPINVQRMVRRMKMLSGVLRASGLAAWGRRNMLAIERREHVLRLAGLPAPFQGVRLLHLSDLHADMDPGTVPALLRALDGWSYDAVVLTGDYRAHTHHGWDEALALCGRVARALRPGLPTFAVLGNHDPLEIVPGLESLGWRVLLNEAAPWSRGGAELWFAGVDDEHTYANADVARARAGAPAGACAILLSHTPSTYARAAQAGFAGFLCGHTHGGQMCLPGGFALLNNGRAPRWTIRGPWQFHAMRGYTSTGVGACRLPARFFCPPEITVHTLEAP
jgi:predicted MPP superfamily phosphohydrolase